MNSPLSLGTPEIILLVLALGAVFVMLSLVVGLIISLARSGPKPANTAPALPGNDPLAQR